MKENDKEKKQYIEIPISEKAVERLIDSVERIAAIYEQVNHKEDLHAYERKNFWQKIWHKITHVHKNSRHLAAYFFLSVAIFGFYLNWKSDIENTRYMQIEREVNKKERKQEILTQAETTARALVLNQITLCGESKLSPQQLKVQRNNALIPLITAVTGIDSIYNKKVYDKVVEFNREIDHITDVCKLDPDKWDNNMRSRFGEITNLINGLIQKDKEKMAKLSAKKENFKLPGEEI